MKAAIDYIRILLSEAGLWIKYKIEDIKDFITICKVRKVIKKVNKKRRKYGLE